MLLLCYYLICAGWVHYRDSFGIVKQEELGSWCSSFVSFLLSIMSPRDKILGSRWNLFVSTHVLYGVV